MNTYNIHYLAADVDIFAAAEENANAEISNFPWQKKDDYMPMAKAFLAYNESALRVCLTAYEEDIRATLCNRNDMVCTDSCMEFFFAPDTEGQFYFNFEANPFGTLYVGCSATGDRSGTHKIDDTPDNGYFNVQSRIFLGRKDKSFWQVAYDIPYEFIRKYIPQFDFRAGKHINANFYKCGESTAHPHWGCWNRIELTKPEYHCRRFFGDIVAE